MRTRLTIGISLLPLLFFCLCFSIIGCVTKNPGQEILTDKSTFLSHLDTLQARYDLTSTLKTKEMRVTIQEADQEPDELRELLWYKKTDDGANLLHIQALGAFNDPRAVAIANRDQFLLVLVEEQEGYLGELSDGVLRKIFGIDLRVSDVLSAIFANPFLDGRTEKIKVKGSGNKFIVTRPGVEVGHTETIVMLIHGNEPQITEWRIVDEQGVLQQSAFFSDYRVVDGILRPNKVEIQRAPEQTRVVVKIGRVELNGEIKDSKFELDPIINSGIEILPFSELPALDDS
ncbi:DUF4292 domain-containing protein [Candidatus Poribacteria bacterium]|nr:DUF4292 domain-containing protein [Candidatus Poribacteria bacterium]